MYALYYGVCGSSSCHILHTFSSSDVLLTSLTNVSLLMLQVLAIEECQLTDVSWSYLHSILKARESSLDDLYWNSTLRTEARGKKNGKAAHSGNGNGNVNRGDGSVEGGCLAQGIDLGGMEDRSVLGDGLVAISLRGNLFSGENMQGLCAELKKAFWLLG